jgi:hypothetical protein
MLPTWAGGDNDQGYQPPTNQGRQEGISLNKKALEFDHGQFGEMCDDPQAYNVMDSNSKVVNF